MGSDVKLKEWFEFRQKRNENSSARLDARFGARPWCRDREVVFRVRVRDGFELVFDDSNR